MKVIELTRGHVAIVDDEDYEKLAQYRWHTFMCKGDRCYARRRKNVSETGNSRKTVMIFMHVEILGKMDGMIIDHKNGNGLDNRRENIRHATNTQNNANTRLYKTSTTGMKGVHFSKKCPRNPYRALISLGSKKKKFLGHFPTKEAAHEAYCAAAKQLHGEFARFN